MTFEVQKDRTVIFTIRLTNGTTEVVEGDCIEYDQDDLQYMVKNGGEIVATYRGLDFAGWKATSKV